VTREERAEAERLRRRLIELDAAIDLEREFDAWRLHRRLRASGIDHNLEALRPLRRSELEYARPRRTADRRPKILVRDFGTITAIR
jgi:hypothetical protein